LDVTASFSTFKKHILEADNSLLEHLLVKITDYSRCGNGIPIDTVRENLKAKKAIVADENIKLLPDG
jgi:hypothetical protein